jgi:membrane-associated protein
VSTTHSVIAAIGIDPNRLIRSVGTLGLFAVIFAESGILLGFFLPGDSLLFTAGLLSATTNVLPPLGVLVVGCSIAAIAGDQFGYGLGRRFGPGIFDRPSSRFLKREHLTRAEAFFERHGSKTVVLARFVPVVRTLTPVIAGASRMQYRRFTIYNIIGGVLWATSFLTLGWALGTRFPGIADYLDIVVVGIIVLSLLPLGIEYARQQRRANRTMEPEPPGG